MPPRSVSLWADSITRLALWGFACGVLLGAVFSSQLFADEPGEAPAPHWPSWRGPFGNGLASSDARPPLHWGPQKNINWKADLPGEGSSTPIIWGRKIFILAAEKTDRPGKSTTIQDDRSKTPAPDRFYRFLVICYDRESGKQIWRRVACEVVPHDGRHSTNTFASSSPVTDGKRLYVSFGSYGVYCFDLDGNLLWSRDLGRMRTRYGWGEAASPALHSDTLIINWDHEDQSFITALKAHNGATRWRVDRDEPTSWATPFIAPFQGQTQVIVNGTNRTRSYELNSGKVLWQCGGQTVNAIPSPFVVNDVAYCFSGYRGATGVAIPLSARGDVTDSKKLIWRHQSATPYVPSALAYRNRIYFSRSNQAILSCLDLGSGKTVFGPQRIPGLRSIYASPIAANGRIYVVGRGGGATVLQAGDELKVLATNYLDQPLDASPVAIGKQLFLRSSQRLYCIQDDAAK